MKKACHYGKPAAALLVAASLLLAACGGSSGGGSSTGNTPPDDTPPYTTPPDTSYLDPPGDTRTWLTVEQMNADDSPEQSPFHNAHFMPVGNPEPALHDFSGTLQFQLRDLETNGARDHLGKRMDLFPDIALQFVSHNGYLLPLDRDRQFNNAGESYWGIVLSPGRVWSEPDDAGWSRASFPFLLIHSHYSQAHNGIATFLYNDSSISRVRIQVVQETASWAMHDYWGHLSASYIPETFAAAADTIAGFDSELADEIPHASWEDLEQLHGSPLTEFDGSVPYDMVSAGAILWDGSLYVSGCRTRYGDFPYCRYMRNAAFSTTKSSVAAIALFRLAQKFGPQVLDEYIEDHVNLTADHDGWTGVTFRNALDMATGVGDYDPDVNSNVTFGDENDEKFLAGFQLADSIEDKLAVVSSYGNYEWGPGTKVRYNSIATFALAVAMDDYLKDQEGPDADLLDMLIEEVYQPIGIRHLPIVRTIEAGNTPGLPVIYSGLYPTLDEIARIARLLQDNGMHDGVPLLHTELTASALYRRTAIGLQAIYWANDIEHTRYQQSFWSWASSEDSGCVVRTPVMVGFGGVLVALLPNGATVMRFADAHFYNPRSLVETARVLGPLCE